MCRRVCYTNTRSQSSWHGSARVQVNARPASLVPSQAARALLAFPWDDARVRSERTYGVR